MNVIDYDPWPTTVSTAGTTTTTVSWHKPMGRGRRYDRLRRGLARRLRIWFVRDTRWEQTHPESRHADTTYGPPWTSDHCLANFSFACTCHKRERYDRRKGR